MYPISKLYHLAIATKRNYKLGHKFANLFQVFQLRMSGMDLDRVKCHSIFDYLRQEKEFKSLSQCSCFNSNVKGI